ncbi:cache domain-containing protein [Amphritea atlantica]|uniref:Cache domain-containing protein n=1 Tax=Amphritea atlantica TaxID=355243 RepID=A0ABY5GXN2_9GAMM|nr:cache domain-containing protein [Amphritea atlantica]
MRKIRNSGLYPFWLVSAILISLLAVLFGYLFLAGQQYVNANLEKLQDSLQLNISRRLQSEVADAAHFINARYHNAEQVIMTRSQSEVLQAIEIMNSLYQQNHGKMPEAELKTMLLEALRGVRFFNGRGYLFVGDQQGKNLLSPLQPDLENHSMTDFKDDRGVYFVRRFLQVSRSEEGRGYVRYRWYPPGDRENMRDKIAFIARFEPFDWLVGAGDYVFQIQEDLQQEMVARLQSIQFGSDGYISIIGPGGKVIAGQGVNRFVGLQPSQLESRHDRERISGLLSKVIADGFIRADWYLADGQPVDDQLLYASLLPVWDWVIIAGGYTDPSLELLLEERQDISQNQTESNATLVLLFMVLLVIGFLMLRYYSRGLNMVFSNYQNNLDQQNITLNENARSLEISRRIVDAAHEGIMITDADNNIIQINDSFTRITGYLFDDVKGQNPNILASSAQNSEFYQAMWSTIETEGEWHGEVWNKRKNGAIYPQALSITCYRNQDGSIENYIGTFTDISQRKAFEEQLEHLAQSDSLTDLPNRRSLSKRLQHELSVLKRYPERQLGLIFLDLDFFKQINDTYGHGIGDQVLLVTARRLSDTVRAVDMVSRVGGDEFVVLLGNHSGEMQRTAIQLAERIIDAVSQPMTIAGEPLKVTTSLGIALAPVDSSDDTRLLEYADLALYHAKQEGRNNYKQFSMWMAETKIG